MVGKVNLHISWNVSLPDEEETIKNETFEGQGKMPLWNLRLHEPDVVGLSWTEYEVAAPSNPFRLGVHIKFCLGLLIKMPTSVPLYIKRDRLVTQVVTFMLWGPNALCNT